MPEKHQPIDVTATSFAGIVKALEERRLPPVESWNPPHCGHSRMRIARDGTWFHEGSPIGRPAMVRLFSTVLRREADGSHVLVTPAEKLTIDVDLAPFVATGIRVEGTGAEQHVAFQLSSGDAVILGPGHPLRLLPDEHGAIPLIMVRSGLEASLSRPVYYELAELALQQGSEPAGIWSAGMFFPLV